MDEELATWAKDLDQGWSLSCKHNQAHLLNLFKHRLIAGCGGSRQDPLCNLWSDELRVYGKPWRLQKVSAGSSSCARTSPHVSSILPNYSTLRSPSNAACSFRYSANVRHCSNHFALLQCCINHKKTNKQRTHISDS